MALWDFHQLSRALSQEALAPHYLLFGDETFLVDEALVALKSVALGEALEDFNFDVFYGRGLDCAALCDVAETLPMMSDRRLVILKEAQELKDKQWDVLMKLLNHPIETTVFVVVANKVDRRKKYVKKFSQKGILAEFKRPYDNQIAQWIKYIAKKHGLEINGAPVQLMHQMVGNNLTDINSEMLKLSQFLGEKRRVVTDEDLVQIVSRVKIESVFELTNAIGDRNRWRALLCLANLLDHGQSEVGVLSLIGRHLRILRLVKQGESDGLSGQGLSARAGVPPFFLRQYVNQSRQWSEQKLDRGFRALYDTDRAIKSSPIPSHIWLENFIIQTCSQ